MAQDGVTTPDETGEGKSIDVRGSETIEIGEEVRELIDRGGETDVAQRFARTYSFASDVGARSVVARSLDGEMVMHVAAVPRLFRGAGVTLTGALLDTFVVDESYRDFWSPIQFVRQAVDLLRAPGTFDFLYSDPGENAFALMRAAGFDLLDSVRTYVFPLVPGWPAHMLCDFPLAELDVQRDGWREGIQLVTESDLPLSESFRVIRTPKVYEGWVHENLTEEAEWIFLRLPSQGPDAPPVAKVLVTPLASHRSLGIMDLAWNDKRVGLESIFYQVALQARRSGFRKLAIRALGMSRLGQAIDRYGFVGRTSEQPVLTKVLKETVSLPAPEKWLLTWMDTTHS